MTAASLTAQPPSLILTGARIWTSDSARPWAGAVANERITAVGDPTTIERLAGPATRTIRLPGRFVAPGFIDHTHFASAGALLLDVSDGSGLIRRVREARDRLPKGAWMVEGDWGAYEAWAQGYEAWAQGSTGRANTDAHASFRPTRRLIDPLTPDTPALLSKWDRSEYLANGRALAASGAEGGWFPEQRIDLDRALRAYTVNNAWAAAEETIKGTVSPGKLADLVVLARDPFTVAPMELKNLKAVLTVVGGRIVHER